MKDGDFLFYCDSGAHFISSITPLIDTSLATKQDIIVFNIDLHLSLPAKYNECLEKRWTKRDALKMLNCDTPKFTDSKQIYASFCLWRKTKFSLDFANELLELSQNEMLITDTPSRAENYPEFIEHRHDQSIHLADKSA